MRVSPWFAVAVTVTLAVTVTVGGCAHPPEHSKIDVPFEVPNDWTAQALGEGEIDDEWWRAFGDARLDALVDEALRSNPDLAGALFRVDQAIAIARIAGADELPQVGFAGNASRSKSLFFAPFNDGPAPQRLTLHNISFDLRWELDVWGRVRAGHSAALADAEAAEAAFHGARLSLIGQVVTTYLAVVDLTEQVRIASANLDDASTTADRIEERYQGGLRTALDLKLIRTDEAQTRATVAALERQLDVTRRQLEILVGRYPDGTIEVATALPEDSPAIPAGLPSDLVRRRPDVVQAERAFAAAEQREHEAWANRLPSFALTASAGTTSERLNDILDLDFSVWNVAGNVAAPIFQGGRLKADSDRAQAVASESLTNFVAVLLAAFAEVESAITAESQWVDQVDALETAVNEAEGGLTVSQDRYFSGVVDILSVLDARRRFFNAQSSLNSARLDRIRNLVDLYLALGGGFEIPEEEAS